VKRIHPVLDLRLGGEELSHRRCILCMAVHAHCQGLDASQHKEAIERARYCAHRVLKERQSLVQLSRSHHNRAPNYVGVAAEILGRRMDDDICTQLERPLQIRRGECAVDRQPCAGTRAVQESATARRSLTRNSGLEAVSSHTSRVFGLNADRPQPIASCRHRRTPVHTS
jgi:hypothetical protein